MSRHITQKELLEWIECYIDHLKGDPSFADNFIDWLDGLLFSDEPYVLPVEGMVTKAMFPHLYQDFLVEGWDEEEEEEE